MPKGLERTIAWTRENLDWIERSSASMPSRWTVLRRRGELDRRQMEAWSSAAPRVIEPTTGRRFPDLREIWRHRDLLYYLARREVAVRYKQSAIGVFWAILQPLLLAVVFSVFFGLLAKVDSQPGVPYPVFAVSGLVLGCSSRPRCRVPRRAPSPTSS